MMVFASTPTLGLLLGLPLAVLAILVCIAVALYARRQERVAYSEWPMLFWGAIGCAVAVFIITAVAMFPYSRDYHFWQPVHGKVEKVAKRLVAAGDSSMEEKIVVVINGQPYGVTDTRASLVKEGDTVSLRCKKAWQWASRAGWDCRWDG